MEKQIETKVKVAMDPVSLFALSLGQVSGGILRDDVQVRLKDGGISQEQIDTFRNAAMDIANAFYN
jgi:hypothetical protein